MTEKVIEASMAAALAVKLSRVKVIPMYPITPQTHCVERIADFINDGEMDAVSIDTESEHSAASALMGASTTGARVFTATASQGLAYMFEVLPIIAGSRLPCVMMVANRALSGPINIWNDHSDSVSARDQGWLQLYVESGQEALDSIIQAYKIAEDQEVLLPVMVCMDGFTLSHVWERVEIPDQKQVDGFLPSYSPKYFLDPKKPISFGPIAYPKSFMTFKKQQQEAMDNALKVIEKVNKEFSKKFGRSYGNGLIESYKLDDAEYALIALGTVCGTIKVAVDKLRKKGKKVGAIRLRSLRPFPEKQLVEACRNLKSLGVIDRHISLGFEGALAIDVKAALAREKVRTTGFIAGLGGKDINLEFIEKAFDDLFKEKSGGWLM